MTIRNSITTMKLNGKHVAIKVRNERFAPVADLGSFYMKYCNHPVLNLLFSGPAVQRHVQNGPTAEELEVQRR